MIVLCCTVIVVSLLSIVSAQEGKCDLVDVPFNSSLVGKQYVGYPSCGRVFSNSRLFIYSWGLVFQPMSNVRFPTPYACREDLVFHFRKRDKRPFVMRKAPVRYGVFQGQRDDPNTAVDERFVFPCNKPPYNKLHRLEIYGHTRVEFIKAVRRMAEGIKQMRDFNCKDIGERAPPNTALPRYTELTVILNFLFSVGYQNFFCAQ